MTELAMTELAMTELAMTELVPPDLTVLDRVALSWFLLAWLLGPLAFLLATTDMLLWRQFGSATAVAIRHSHAALVGVGRLPTRLPTGRPLIRLRA